MNSETVLEPSLGRNWSENHKYALLKEIMEKRSGYGQIDADDFAKNRVQSIFELLKELDTLCKGYRNVEFVTNLKNTIETTFLPFFAIILGMTQNCSQKLNKLDKSGNFFQHKPNETVKDLLNDIQREEAHLDLHKKSYIFLYKHVSSVSQISSICPTQIFDSLIRNQNPTQAPSFQFQLRADFLKWQDNISERFVFWQKLFLTQLNPESDKNKSLKQNLKMKNERKLQQNISAQLQELDQSVIYSLSQRQGSQNDTSSVFAGVELKGVSDKKKIQKSVKAQIKAAIMEKKRKNEQVIDSPDRKSDFEYKQKIAQMSPEVSKMDLIESGQESQMIESEDREQILEMEVQKEIIREFYESTERELNKKIQQARQQKYAPLIQPTEQTKKIQNMFRNKENNRDRVKKLMSKLQLKSAVETKIEEGTKAQQIEEQIPKDVPKQNIVGTNPFQKKDQDPVKKNPFQKQTSDPFKQSFSIPNFGAKSSNQFSSPSPMSKGFQMSTPNTSLRIQPQQPGNQWTCKCGTVNTKSVFAPACTSCKKRQDQ